MFSVRKQSHQGFCDIIGFSVAFGFAVESGKILANSGVPRFNSRSVLFSWQMLVGRQNFGIHGIVIGMKDCGLIPWDMRHQLAERFGRAITNS